MQLIVISPEQEDPRETAVLGALLAAGLTHYHVRKPGWSSDQLRTWLTQLPAAWRPHLVLHSHHPLVTALGLGGRHWRDDGRAPAAPGAGYTSCSCHDLAGLRRALGRYSAVFFGPLFAAHSKPGYGPVPAAVRTGLATLLAERTPAEQGTAVIALGGITAERVAECAELGCDGVAVLGGLWQTQAPLATYAALRSAAAPLLQ